MPIKKLTRREKWDSLRLIGLVSGKPTDYALKKASKIHATLSAANPEIVKHPEKYFIKRLEKKTAAILSESHTVINGRLIYRKRGSAHTLRIKRRGDQVELKTISAERSTRSIAGRGKTLFQKLQKMKLKPGEYVTFAFGDRQIHLHFSTTALAIQYLSKFDNSKLQQINIVKWRGDDGED